MSTRNDVLSKFLQCDYGDTVCLDSIVMDADEFFDQAKSKTLDGLIEEAYNQAVAYLNDLYRFAYLQIKNNPDLYLGSVLKWDSQLLMESLEFLDPTKDLHWDRNHSNAWLELDYWDLYFSVVDTINEDYNSARVSMGIFMDSFFREIEGGQGVPDRFSSLLL